MRPGLRCTTAGTGYGWYRFSGKQIGYVGNNGTIDTDYASSITNRTAAQRTGAFQNGAASGTSSADFDLAYDSGKGDTHSFLHTVDWQRAIQLSRRSSMR